MNWKLFAVAAAIGLAPSSTSPKKTYSTRDDLALTGVTYTVWYDSTYDQRENPLSSVVCSSGEFGLLTQGYNVFGDLPSYPFIGGAPQIQGWNSPYCGSCWELTYVTPSGISTSLSFTAINSVAQPQESFSISVEGLNSLTDGNAYTLDGVSITVASLPDSSCGLYEVK